MSCIWNTNSSLCASRRLRFIHIQKPSPSFNDSSCNSKNSWLSRTPGDVKSLGVTLASLIEWKMDSAPCHWAPLANAPWNDWTNQGDVSQVHSSVQLFNQMILYRCILNNQSYLEPQVQKINAFWCICILYECVNKVWVVIQCLHQSLVPVLWKL